MTKLERVAHDLLFASSGIESEIAQDALPLEILPGFVARVARIGHLLALKILAGREIDQRDARVLLGLASADELARARSVIDLIAHRGFNRGKDLGAEFDRLRESSGPRRSG